jgi:hypothetical protein
MPPRHLTVRQILHWADAFRRRTGRWPSLYAGPIAGAAGETWRRVDNALRLGLRGLPGGSSLAQLLAAWRDARNQTNLPRLSELQVLRWADAHRQRTGSWPVTTSGPVRDAPEETWRRVDNALRLGLRGLPGGNSLARLLARRRGVRNLQALPRLTVRQILIWADAQHRQTGAWPTRASGRILYAPAETWAGINAALKLGRRGLPGGDSLPRLLARERGVRNLKALPPLAVGQIRRWAEAYRTRTGRWPEPGSGPIAEAPGETWAMVDRALRQGQRGLQGGRSLYRLLRKRPP